MFKLLKLLHRQPADILNNAKAADEWLRTLRREDSYEAQKKVNDVLAAFLQSRTALSKDRLKALMHLDEASQIFQADLRDTYLHHRSELHAGAEILWTGMTTQFSHLAHAYQAFIREIVIHHGKAEFSRYLPTLTARALHYHAQGIKWGYFRQEPVLPAAWKRLHKFRLMCENGGFSATEVELNSKTLTTCGNEYIQILLLDMIKPMTLPPAQLELVDRMLDLWSHLVTLEADCDPETHMHCVDLASGAGARKLLDEMHGPSLRCWSMAELYLQIRKSRTGLSEGDWNVHQALGDECVLPDCINLLDYVARYWIRPEAARRQNRAPVEDRMVEMACGVGAIHSCLKPAEEHAGHKIPFEHWSVQDESEGGYGLVEARPTERAQEGKLVLVKPPGHEGAWEIGVVRWKKDTESGLPSLGIERLSDDPKQVELTLAGEGENRVIKALFLPKLYQRDIDSSLILQASDYNEAHQLDMHYRNNVIRIRLTEVVDNSEEWVRVHFAVLGKSGGQAKAH